MDDGHSWAAIQVVVVVRECITNSLGVLVRDSGKWLDGLALSFHLAGLPRPMSEVCKSDYSQ